ncbi:hypothetical protein EA661_12870 [Pseudoxanthomonas winnipegensis]|uniref:Uncharacterized protein n=1 Tax=Pseudoxanthomonas winnipegensis TaxID=2480810 RepID=A0A4Q8LFJ4_9GAMM|nr:hypothetical protein [Pseudoxanthomonas winnipegensis]TAA27643.1 hypothetical protein EA661_12870 [Pseudoxanthomonas winnipegensis]
MNLDPNNAIARVDTSRILMALPFRPYGDIRYYINAIALQPAGDDGVLVMATDGYAAICLRDIGGRADRPMLIPVGKEQKAALKRGTHLLVSPEGMTWISDDSGFPLWVSTVPLIEGKFPDLRSVAGDVESYRPGLVGGFNPNLLDQVRQAHAYGPKPSAVRFFHRPENAALTLFTLDGSGFGLVMGMTDDVVSSSPSGIPAYFRSQAAEAST